jgi:histidine kinase
MINTSSLQLFHDGSNSLLYFQEDLANGNQLVVKVLKDDSASANRTANFYNEYEIAKDLEINGVPKYYSKETLEGRPAILMEYMDGKPLKLVFDKDNRPTIKEFLNIAIEATQILSEIHQNHIIHKDLNGNNILFNENDRSVKIIDFGISSRFDLKEQNMKSPDVLEGTLAYISPEQTGRMNRIVDYRTDLYSLGITFYELLTGRVPFESRDSMELVHCHIARKPLAICEIAPNVPVMISEIVMQLLEKSASDRYQSAYGLKMDLQRCLDEIEIKGEIELFEIGQKDYSEKLQIPEKLYGCEIETETLLHAFERVSEGNVELMLVKGYAGVGKSSLINEVHRPITERRGYFIRGKHDQYQRNIPYSAFIQAFNDFVEQILTEPPNKIAKWKSKILNAVGENGNILIDVIPNLRLIIGAQPPKEELSALESANRFNYVFRRFIQALAKKEHPLVLFVDDLQWADAATLSSIRLLISDSNNKYLLIVGAYRDNEVDSAHPLSFMLDEVLKSKAKINVLHLDNLDSEHVQSLVSETLRTTKEEIKELANLVYTKTQGNAFFVNQFLKSLFEEELLKFDFHLHKWAWELDQIQNKNITNNVVELMAGKIEKLPGNTRDALQLASCIGDKFDLQTLSHIYVRAQVETFNTIWKAVEEGLIIPLDDNYKIIPALEAAGQILVKCEFQFLHDRVQQAAYQLIPEAEKKRVHYKVGKLILENIPKEEQKDRIFEVINHFNSGIEYVLEESEKMQVAELNRIAGEKAKGATAYDSSFDYLQKSLSLLGSNSWEIDYEATWTTYIEAAEISYLAGNRDEMERIISLILTHTKDTLDKVKAYEVKIQAYTSDSEMEKAVQAARKVLALLGVKFPKKSTKAHLLLALGGLEMKLKGKSSEDLLNLPKMEDIKMRAVVRILSANAIAAYFSDKNLYALFIIKQVSLALKYGNAYSTCGAYESLAIIYTAILKKYERGFFFGELGMKLMEKRDAKKFVARNGMIFHGIIRPWVEHAASGIGALNEAYRKGLEYGDFEYSLHSALEVSLLSIYTGKPLKPLLETSKKYLHSAMQVKQLDPLHVLMVQTQFVENLVEPCKDYSRLVGTYFNEPEQMPAFFEKNEGSAIASGYFVKFYAAYIFDEYHYFDEYRKIAYDYAPHVVGTVGGPFLTFIDGLARTKLVLDNQSEDAKRDLKQAKSRVKALQKLEKFAPMNITHRVCLIEACIFEIEQKFTEAEASFAKGIKLAEKEGYMNDVAVGLENFARYWFRRDNEPIASMYFKKAYLAYEKWGAVAKMEQMKEKYYEFLLPDETPNLQSTTVDMVDLRGGMTTMQTTRRFNTMSSTHSTTDSRGTSMLDFGTLIKASHAISEEVNLEKMLEKMLQITIENAGAERAVFIRHDKESLKIWAEYHPDGQDGMAVNVNVSESNGVPSSLVHYVARTKKAVVLENATTDSTYSFDSYIKRTSPKSVFCFPVMNHAHMTGIIYMENNLITNAFTSDRLEIMDLLSAQIAISLDNALLYDNLEQKVSERTQKLNESNEDLKDKNDKITDSIRYAQTIQNAILPTESQLQEAFSNHFLLFRPKDIVSGDFYWMNQSGNTTFIAVADCTGHGVPGAFMSMIGSSLLDDIVSEKKIHEPAMMLEMLHVGIRLGLKQEKTDNDDGMDVCLCAITKEQDGTFKVEFAGAKRPLYYVEKNSNSLQTAKGSNKEIGGFLKKKDKPFENQIFQFRAGTQLYLSTDGYVDQSNSGLKKLGSTLFMEMLESNSKYPLKKQKEVLGKILDLHAGNVEQRDDITILGIEL